ncbi:MAG: hypothetical protein E6K80_00230, partial [Candidatus Eisenbacteria bacterium]
MRAWINRFSTAARASSHAAAEAARDAGAHRSAHLVAVERAEQLAAGLVESRAQGPRIAAEQAVEPALEGFLGGREHERQHQRRDHVEGHRLLAGPGGEEVLTHEHDAQVDRGQHTRQKRPRNAALEDATRIEYRIAGHEERQRERREEHADPDHRDQHAHGGNLIERVGAFALQPPAHESRGDVHERDGEAEHALAPDRMPVAASRETEAIDQRDHAEQQRGRLEQHEGELGHAAGLEETQHESDRHEVGDHDQPEPHAAHAAPRLPARAREHREEVQEGRGRPAHEPAVEAHPEAQEAGRLEL